MLKNEVKQESKNLGSINPKDEKFNFDLWAKQVRTQMIETLERKLNSKSLMV